MKGALLPVTRSIDFNSAKLNVPADARIVEFSFANEIGS